jgi:biopolymer transport protein ExbD
MLAQLRRAGESTAGFTPRIVVQGDRGIEFRLLHRVITTSHLAGYTHVSLAVVQDGAAVAMAGTAAP